MVAALCGGVWSGGGGVSARETAGAGDLTCAHVGEQPGRRGRAAATACAACAACTASASALLSVEEQLCARVGHNEPVVQRVHDALAPEGQVTQAPELRQRPFRRPEPALDERQLIAYVSISEDEFYSVQYSILYACNQHRC